jgi:hypothetical protein
MTFSYSDPSNSFLDECRYMIGDTDPDYPLLEDEEILFALKKFNNEIYQSAMFSCHRIIMKVSSLVDEKEGQVSISSSQIQLQYKQRIKDLELEMSNFDPPFPACGGINSSHYHEVIENKETLKKQFNDFDGDNPRARHGF